ncbi:MAG TPA: ABC transporter permease [Gammaproteobacteria bacterium]|nr:ABC transporter permease [Gammaproteobacteria bacterium]
MIWVLARRELQSLFLSPLAWSILAVIQFIMAYIFLYLLQTYIEAQPQLAMMESAPGVSEVVIGGMFQSTAFFLLLVIPLITMRVFSEERRSKTLPLLFSAPISMTEIVLGKFFGVLAFLAIMLGLLTLMPLSILVAGTIDFGMLASVLIGALLLLGAFASAGLFISTLTKQPIVAAVSTFGFLLFLWLIDIAASSVSVDGDASALSYLSLVRHFDAMAKGVFSSSDVIFYLLFITTFLVLSIRRLDNDRLQH